MMWQILVIAVLTWRGLTQGIFNSNVPAVKTPPGGEWCPSTSSGSVVNGWSLVNKQIYSVDFVVLT
jgi:hypothetical protein